MNPETHQKVTASHLKRGAYLYVRQSTLRQVIENTESTIGRGFFALNSTFLTASDLSRNVELNISG